MYVASRSIEEMTNSKSSFEELRQYATPLAHTHTAKHASRTRNNERHSSYQHKSSAPQLQSAHRAEQGKQASTASDAGFPAAEWTGLPTDSQRPRGPHCVNVCAQLAPLDDGGMRQLLELGFLT